MDPNEVVIVPVRDPNLSDHHAIGIVIDLSASDKYNTMTATNSDSSVRKTLRKNVVNQKVNKFNWAHLMDIAYLLHVHCVETYVLL